MLGEVLNPNHNGAIEQGNKNIQYSHREALCINSRVLQVLSYYRRSHNTNVSMCTFVSTLSESHITDENNVLFKIQTN